MIQLLWQSNEYFIQHLKSLNFIEGIAGAHLKQANVIKEHYSRLLFNYFYQNSNADEIIQRRQYKEKLDRFLNK